MATNLVYKEAVQLSVVCTHPTTPASGDPVRFGNLTGVALTNESVDGNLTGYTSVDFAMRVWDLTVDDNEGAGIAVGDAIFYHDTGTGTGSVHLNNSATSADAFFGFAFEVVTANATTLINVLHVSYGFISSLASNAVVTGSITNSAVTEVKVAPASLSGTVVKVGADANVIGAIPVVHRIDIAAGALGNTDVVLTHKTRVIDAHLILRGAGVATTTLQVKNGANAITNAMAASGSDQALVRAATIDDAYHEIAAAGTLRVTSATGATQPDATVYVLGIRVA